MRRTGRAWEEKLSTLLQDTSFGIVFIHVLYGFFVNMDIFLLQGWNGKNCTSVLALNLTGLIFPVGLRVCV